MTIGILLVGTASKYKVYIQKIQTHFGCNFQIGEVNQNKEEILLFLQNKNIDVVFLYAQEKAEFWLLIGELKQANKNLEIVLICQNANFDLAFQAIQNRIQQFVLEPIDDNTFLRIITEVQDKKLLIESEQDKENRLLSFELSQHQKLMEKVMTQMMEKPEELAVMIGEVNQRYQLNLKNTFFFAIVIVILDLLNTSQKDYILQEVQNVYRERLTSVDEILISSHTNIDIRVVVNMDDNQLTPDILESLYSVEQDILQILSSADMNHWLMGIGPVVNSMQEIQKSVDKAVHILHSKRQNKKEHILFDTDTPLDKDSEKLMHVEIRKQVQKYLRQFQIENLNIYISKLMMNEEIIENPYDAQRFVLQIIQLAKEIWSNQKQAGNLDDLLCSDIFQYIYDPQLKKDYLIRILKDIAEKTDDRSQHEMNRQISRALEFIHQNYNQMITLENVALEVDLSPNYFSSLFREEIGINYRDYVSEYRMNKSKNLLRETDWTIEHIANEIGYQDVKYFSQQFKKITGITPGKYRKSIVEGEKHISSQKNRRI